MILWLTWVLVGICLLGAVLCGVDAVRVGAPDDPAMFSVAAVVLGLIAQTIIAIVFAATGHGSIGDGLEWGGYLATAFVVIVGAAFWGLIERTRVSAIILGIGCLTVAIMLVRMHQIWYAPTWLPGQ